MWGESELICQSDSPLNVISEEEQKEEKSTNVNWGRVVNSFYPPVKQTHTPSIMALMMMTTIEFIANDANEYDRKTANLLSAIHQQKKNYDWYMSTKEIDRS